MKKNILKSNSSLVLIGQSPAWTTGQDYARLFSLVQNCDFSITANRQKIKQVGSQSYSVNALMRAPDVSVTMDYYLTPYLNNECLLGFAANTSGYQPAISNLKSANNNIYLIIDTEEARDGLSQFKQPNPSIANFSGYNAVTFGNCYLNKYSVNFSLGQVPKVSVGFASSNARFENLTASKVSIPAINSVSGNNIGSGFLDLSGAYTTITSGFVSGDVELRTEYNPPVAVPNTSTFTLQDLQIGGANLAKTYNPILESFSLSMDLPRIDLYGLGSNYVYDRKLHYPINGQAQMACKVSGMGTGNLDSYFTTESGYAMEVAFCDSHKYNTGFYKIENARLDSVSYAMQVNDSMTFNASFSFEINDTGGFLMKRSAGQGFMTWADWDVLWQNMDLNWNAA